MKKVYMSIFSLVVGTIGVNAQLDAIPAAAENIQTTNQKNAFISKAVGATLWSDSFDDASVWVIDNDGLSGASYGWSIDANADSWGFNSGINSTSGGNFAEVGNSDGSSPTSAIVGKTYTMTTANPIDIAALNGGNGNATLSFQQYGAKFNDVQEVQISTNGTDFATVFDNNDDAPLTADAGSVYPNPETIVVDISSSIAANPNQVWLRFYWTSAFPTNTSPNAWVTYGWYIDDIVIKALPDHDITYTNRYFGTSSAEYYQIPVNQIAPIDFSVNILNQGKQTQTNVKLNLDANGALTSSATTASLAPAGTDSLYLTYTPADAGTYNFNVSLVADSVDDVPLNNAFYNIAPVIVGGEIYARDEGTFDGSVTRNNEGDPSFETGSFYDIITEDICGVIDVGIDADATVGSKFYVGIKAIVGDNVEPIAFSDEVEITQQDLGSIKSVLLSDAVTLTAGESYLVYAGTVETGVKFATAGYSQPGVDPSRIGYPTLSFSDDNGNIFQGPIPVIRLNFLESLGLDEAGIETTVSQNVPNPFSANTKITFDVKDAQKVSLTVTDLSGKVVKSMNLGVMNPGVQSVTLNGADFAEGIYTYTLTVGNNSSTKKMIVKK